MVRRSADRRKVIGYAKPLFPAAAPMELAKVCRAIEWRLLFKFVCGCGSANERKPEPEQRQRKENGSVLPKESERLLRHGNNKTMPVPSKGYTGDYPLCASLVTFCADRKSPQRSVRRTHRNHRRFFGEYEKSFRALPCALMVCLQCLRH